MTTATAAGIAPAAAKRTTDRSLADRVCDWFRQPGNRDEELGLADIAQRYQVTMPVARAQLEEAPVDQRLVHVAGDLGKVYKAGPKLKPAEPPAGAPAPLPNLAAPPKRNVRKHLPAPAVSTVQRRLREWSRA